MVRALRGYRRGGAGDRARSRRSPRTRTGARAREFADRTLLELRRDRQAARLLLPDGERVEVRASAPMRWGAYGARDEFGRWAFLTPGARRRRGGAGSRTRACARSSMASGGSRQWTRGSFRAIGAVDAADATYEAVPRGASASAPSTPDPRAASAAFRAHRAPVERASSCPPRARGPLREAEARAGGGARVRPEARPWTARASEPGEPREAAAGWEEDDEKMKEPRSRASFLRRRHVSPATEEERRCSAKSGRRRSRCSGGARPPAAPRELRSASVARPRWRRPRDGWRASKASSRRAARPGRRARGLAPVPGAAARMDAVAAALDSNEKWLAGELERRSGTREASDRRPPDF